MSRLSEIEARLAAAMGKQLDIAINDTRRVVTIETSPEVWELIRGALSADLADLVAAARAFQAARRDLDHHHAHIVPGKWDKDGSHCDVCERVGAMDAALNDLEAS